MVVSRVQLLPTRDCVMFMFGYPQRLTVLRLASRVQLFQGLALPAVRRSVFPVVSLMLLGFQHSPAAFFKVSDNQLLLHSTRG